MADSENDSLKSAPHPLLNPVVLIAGAILVSIFVLIGAAILGHDSGVLSDMAKTEFARGLITYLFAVVTIGTAVVLVVSALTSGSDDKHKEQFQRGKEILSLLLGVFGTIVGFYFGSAVKGQAEQAGLSIAALHLSANEVTSKTPFVVTTLVSGGQSPVKYSVVLENESPTFKEEVGPKGWITKEIVAPEAAVEKEITVKVVVKDSAGHIAEESAKVSLKPTH